MSRTVSVLGVTGSVEFTPGDRTKLSVDGLYAYYTDVHQELFGEGLLRSFERSIDVRDYTIDPDTGTLVAATFDNVQERTETRRDDDRTRFYQVNATLSQEFSDSFRATLFGGFPGRRPMSPIPHPLSSTISAPAASHTTMRSATSRASRCPTASPIRRLQPDRDPRRQLDDRQQVQDGETGFHLEGE